MCPAGTPWAVAIGLYGLACTACGMHARQLASPPIISACESTQPPTGAQAQPSNEGRNERHVRVCAGEEPPPISNATQWIQRMCGTSASGRELYAQQDLFSIYVHRRADAEPFPRDSIFSGREIHQRCAPPRAATRAIRAASAYNADRKSPRSMLGRLCAVRCARACMLLSQHSAHAAPSASASRLASICRRFRSTDGRVVSAFIEGVGGIRARGVGCLVCMSVSALWVGLCIDGAGCNALECAALLCHATARPPVLSCTNSITLVMHPSHAPVRPSHADLL